jgi:hypothetical protein
LKQAIEPNAPKEQEEKEENDFPRPGNLHEYGANRSLTVVV